MSNAAITGFQYYCCDCHRTTSNPHGSRHGAHDVRVLYEISNNRDSRRRRQGPHRHQESPAAQDVFYAPIPQRPPITANVENHAARVNPLQPVSFERTNSYTSLDTRLQNANQGLSDISVDGPDSDPSLPAFVDPMQDFMQGLRFPSVQLPTRDELQEEFRFIQQQQRQNQSIRDIDPSTSTTTNSNNMIGELAELGDIVYSERRADLEYEFDLLGDPALPRNESEEGNFDGWATNYGPGYQDFSRQM